MMNLPAQALRTVALLAFILPVVHAQMPILTDSSLQSTDPNAKLPSYDVASVKPNKSGENMMRIMNHPDGFSCNNISLKTLIGNAYGIRQDLITGGPGWVDSTGFDVEAKVSAEDVEAFKKLNGRQRNTLLQALLADRFHLKVHHETKILPMYDLLLAKGGSRMKANPPVPPSPDAAKDPEAAKPRGMMTMGPGMLKGQGLSMTSIANQLSYALEATVVDKTGLTGDFDFDLKWTPDDAGPAKGDASTEPNVSIYTAVQEQLGLKLQPTKGPVDTLVIDHAEQPSEN
jgi:uncharacterized protein (TIGR03435 family)